MSWCRRGWFLSPMIIIVNLSPMTGPRLVSTNLAEDNEISVKVSTTFNFNMVWKLSFEHHMMCELSNISEVTKKMNFLIAKEPKLSCMVIMIWNTNSGAFCPNFKSSPGVLSSATCVGVLLLLSRFNSLISAWWSSLYYQRDLGLRNITTQNFEYDWLSTFACLLSSVLGLV